MITKTFAAPIGSGLRTKLVAPEAIATGRRVTFIVPHKAVFECNWSKQLPDATYILPLTWLNRAEDADTDLIIVDCIHSTMMDRIRATLHSIATEVWVIHNDGNELAPLTNQRALEGMKRLGIISELEDLSVTLGGSSVRINTSVLTEGIQQPDIEGYVVGDRGVVPFSADSWAHGPSSQALAEQIAAMREPAAEAAPIDTASKRTMAKLTGNIQSIDQTELDRLLAPYIRFGLLRTIYTTTTRATEYRGPSGKLIAITIGRNHYRARDAVLGSTPRNIPAHMLLTKDQIRESSAGAGKSVVIPFPGGAA